MLVKTYLQQSTLRLLLSGIFVVGILCLLAAWNYANKTEYFADNTGSNGFTIAVDMPLHANGEVSLALKRFIYRYKNQPKPVEPIDPIWALSSGEFIVVLPCVAASQHTATLLSPYLSLYQLQTLNISRAPPLV
ncbi:hypothetical protein [Cellvibrio fibrivorans]|uniref:Uncharacterized protein n=1 Tax=Cellvibrio fibrivorans TaxID=126350 RepID=A0ABU1UZA6_9GAMM|nr:hypothetical protein [Cellvibrio fibrivorans]MDR7090519.1 hypothetical protein [Cellvibrio fibrivorans]